MTKRYLGFRWSFAVIVAVGTGFGCSQKGNDVGSSHDRLTGPNGMIANGMIANGMIANGMIANGMIANGMIANGMIANGLFQGGTFKNGPWLRIFDNSVWQPGLTGDAAAPGDLLRSNGYLRQLLQYMYSCAMPPTDSGELDPTGGALTCAVPTDCDFGYECSSQHTCVVPLVGLVGVGINADGTSWSASGTCDESCQRWVSACILARTNAYGVHVLVSMRAPANTPPGRQAQFDNIRKALETTADERSEFGTREGAYYGNLFATTPGTYDASDQFVPDWIAKKMPTGSSIGTVDQYSQFVPGLPPHADGPADVVMMTPTFSACAGPGSNVPDITRRFCSSQGNNVIINVPGPCLPYGAEPGACAPDDGNVDGAMHDCFTNTDPTLRTAADEYNEVITVYVKTAIAVCGNQMCEEGEDSTSCKNDCPDGIWTKDFDASFGFGGGIVDVPADYTNFPQVEMAVVAPRDPNDPTEMNDSVVVVGRTSNPVDVGGGLLPAEDGYGVIAKYDGLYGTHRWSHRFKPSAPPAPGYETNWDVSGGITVAPNGNIVVVGTMVQTYCVIPIEGPCFNQPVTAIWVDTFAPNGSPIDAFTYTVPIGANPLVKASNSSNAPLVHARDVTLTRAVAADSDGNVYLGAGYCGTLAFPDSIFQQWVSTTNCDLRSYSGLSLATALTGFGLFAAKIGPPTVWSSGTTAWVRSLGEMLPPSTVSIGGDTGSGGGNGNPAGYEGMSLVLVPSNSSYYDVVLLTSGAGAKLTKLSGINGSDMWPPIQAGIAKFYSVAAVDQSANVYVGGYFGAGADFSGCGEGPTTSVLGLPPFVQQLDQNGGCKWVRYGTTVCPDSTPGSNPSPCGGSFNASASGRPQVQAVSVGFDPMGNVILGSYGNPVVGGGIDFGGKLYDAKVGTFPTYSANNIFLSTYTAGAGQLIWAKQVPTILGSFLLGMESDHQGRILLSGNFSGSMEVLGHLLVTGIPEQPKVIDAFLASFDPPSLSDHLPPKLGEIPASPGQTDPPVKTVPQPILTQATSAKGADVFFLLPTANDDGNAGSSVACAPAPSSTFPLGTTTVTCTASDAVGNQSPPASFTVTVADKVGPVLLRAPDITVQATTAAGEPVVYGLPRAIDQVDGPVTPSCLPASGSLFSIGKTTVTCTASDHAAPPNTSQMTFLVTVTPPPVTVSCVGTPSSPVQVSTSPGVCSATVSNGGLAGTCSSTAALVACTFDGASSDTLGPGDHLVSVVGTGTGGSTASCTSYVRVADNEKPTVTCPGQKVECAGVGGTTVTPVASCTDNCSCTASCTPALFPVGTSPGSCKASDPAGNSATCQPSITVVDTRPPTTTATPGPSKTPDISISINITSYSVTPKGGGTAVTGSASCWTSSGVAIALSAADACAQKEITYALTGAQTGGATVAGGVATVTVTTAGSTTVSYYATDKAGNKETAKTVPILVGKSVAGFGFSCAPSPSLKNLPAHGTVTAKGTVTITNTRTGQKVTSAFSFTQSY